MTETAEIEWHDGVVPVSTRFDDPYFSIEDGLAETRHVFLGGNDLPVRFTDGFHIGELGFGTGLNFLTAVQVFRDSGIGGVLHFTSFEAFPLSRDAVRKALEQFAGLPTDILIGAKHGKSALPPRIIGDDFDLTLVFGDVRQTLPDWTGRADAWFLDGFSPAKNPQMWGADLLAEVARHTAAGGTFATYTAAGHVRRSLSEAGFVVERAPGFGRKRHMSRGRLA